MAEGVRYIKVAKKDKDGNDQSLSLQSLSELNIPYSTGNVRYEILSISEHDNYFLYYVENPNIEHADRATLNYSFSGSYTGSHGSLRFTPRITSSLDNQGFFITGSTSEGGLGTDAQPIDSYRVMTYNQKNLVTRASSSIQFAIDSAKSATTSVSASVRIVSSPLIVGNIPQNPTVHAESILTQSLQDVTTNSLHFTGSYDISADLNSSSFNNGDCIYFEFRAAKDGDSFEEGGVEIADFVFTNGIFEISSSVASGPTMETIPEPFLAQNFDRAFDCQPLLNNTTTNRRSSKYQDVDYSTNLMVPVNFDLLISGSALKAEVQDSNYTLKRHILPRYKGSKSTSQFLNVFTRGDRGNLGTLPTAEQLSTQVSYADWSGGYLPEHNNAFGAHLKYFIKSDGNITIPGSTPNVLEDNKNIFRVGDTVEISSETQTSNGDPGEFKTIIRGGKRITPILTNQVGHSPTIFSSSIDMVNKDGTEIGTVINDFNGSFNNENFDMNKGQILTRSGSFIDFQTPLVESSGSGCNVNNSRLIISQSMIDQGVSLTIEGDIKFQISKQHQNGPISAFAIIKNLTTDEQLAYKAVNGSGELIINTATSYIAGTSVVEALNTTGELNIQYTIPNTDMTVGDEYGIQVAGIVSETTQSNHPFYVSRGSTFKVTQNPVPGITVLTKGLWTSGSLADSSWPYTIISSDPTIVNFYNNKEAKQKPIGESGFFPFENSWGLEPGDEFRFEAREDRVFIIKEAYVSSSRLFIEVNRDLPPSGSVGVGGSMNYDNFLIRRYVDDPSGLILAGSKPVSDGPYIIKTQYLDQELNENLPNYIQDLKEKGII